MKLPGLLFFYLLLFLSACQSDTPPATKEGNLPQFIGQEMTLASKVTAYAQANEQPLAQLNAGDKIVLTGLVSPALYTSYSQSDTLVQPYLQIQLHPQQTAWVFGHPAFFNLKEDPQTWQWRNRLQAVLSSEAYNRYQELAPIWTSESQAAILLLAFQATRNLRDELTAALAKYPALSLSEARNLLPGCLAYQENRHLAWWLDFPAWETRCARTTSKDDDALFRYYRSKIYPPDGIEYRFPVWTFPVSPTEGHSLLGRGIHLEILQQLDSLQAQYPLARAEWQYLAQQIVSDITDPRTTFWEDMPIMQQELAEIVGMSSTLITSVQKSELRLTQDLWKNKSSALERVNFRER